MTFVFEACELPFGDITDDYASRIRDVIAAFDIHHLPLWDRCLLAAVLPVVVQRRQAIAASDAAATAATISREEEDIHQRRNAPEDGEAEESAQRACDGGDVADAADVQRPSPASSSTPTAATLADIEVALTMVRQLDELEVVYDSILSTRRAQQEKDRFDAGAGSAGIDAPAPARTANQPKKTSEEIIMEQLMQERFSDTAPYLPESDDDDDDASGEDVVDVAMCFTTQGESLGIGSAAVFGGHGYHPC